MAFENLLKRRGRTQKQNRLPSFSYEKMLGVDYSSSIYARDPQDLPYGLNADMGSPIGAISKAPGFEALIASLGAGGFKGLQAWQHSTGDKMLLAHDKYLYLATGDTDSIAKSVQADWEAGIRTNIDTSGSPGDVKILKGTDFSQTATLTADFNGTHSQTTALTDSVKLTNQGAVYSTDQCSGVGTAAIGGVGTYGFSEMYKAFDNSESTYAWTGRGAYQDDWIGFDFGTGITKQIRRLRVKQSGTNRPDSILFRYSDDGTNWTTAATIYPTQTDGSWEQWDIPASGAHQFWSLRSYESFGEGYWKVYEIEMMTIVSQYYASGVYTDGVKDPSAAKRVGANSITFNKTTPAATALTVEMKLSTDEGTTWGEWTAKNSGDNIVPIGTDISKYRFQWRANLSTTDTTATPSLDDVTVSFTAVYYSLATLILSNIDLGKVPSACTLTFTQTVLANSTVSWYARGSSNGTIFGDWQAVLSSGDKMPLQRYQEVKIDMTSTDGTSSPTVSDLLISFSTDFTTANKLDIGPLGRTSNLLTGNRVSMVNYEDWCLMADGLRPFLAYLSTATQLTGTAQGGAAGYITLPATASTVDDFYNNAFVTITGGTGSGQVRWVSDYVGSTKRVIPSVNFNPAPDNTSVISIGSAVKLRNLGVDPPVNAPTVADSGTSGSPSGTYLYKVTTVNADGVEGNPSPASSSLSVASKKITVTKPSGIIDATITKWRVYRTSSGGSVYKYVAEVDIGTAIYTDNTADVALGRLMYDNNNIPPNCDFLYQFTSYVFFAKTYEMGFSKAGSPDQFSNISGDIQVIEFPGNLGDIKSHPMALIVAGLTFEASITSNSGFIFDSDPTVDTTTMKIIDTNGGLSWAASAMCLSPNLRSTLIMNTNTGLRAVVPGLQDNSVETVPLSYKIQPYYERSINRDQAAGVFFNNYYLYSMEHMPAGGSESERLTFAYDWRTERWYGPWEFGMSCYTISGNVLYAGDAENGIIYRMFSGDSYAGQNIHMKVDLPMQAPAGENGTCKFHNVLPIISGDSDTSVTVMKPKVDEREASIPLGALATTFTGEARPGHNFIRPRKSKIPLPAGHTFSLRIEDDSTHPLQIEKVVVEYEKLNINR